MAAAASAGTVTGCRVSSFCSTQLSPLTTYRTSGGEFFTTRGSEGGAGEGSASSALLAMILLPATSRRPTVELEAPAVEGTALTPRTAAVGDKAATATADGATAVPLEEDPQAAEEAWGRMRDMECRPGAEAIPSSSIEARDDCMEAISRSRSSGPRDIIPELAISRGDVAGLLRPSKNRTGTAWTCPPSCTPRLTAGVNEEGLLVPTSGLYE
mmetsp:Transcript_47995/g.86324  ORF Transcript_47995/g.86324 Transcript_47995/m.86324 type:complete len:213 (-) Transcript_47995:299-937(-)